jgi:anaerobic ribonucleoside-triphosphate reductase activating protein
MCAGCCNPKLLELKPVHILTFGELFNIITEAKKKFNIEGITYLGGEPTLQHGLAKFSAEVKAMGLGIILFTGKSFEELPIEIKTTVDLIVDGDFKQDKRDTKRNLIGSTNQQIVFITDRYRSYEQWFYKLRPKCVEINIASEIFITGDNVIKPSLIKN